MNYTLQLLPSLQQIAGMKIVSKLWNLEDIKTELEKCERPSFYGYSPNDLPNVKHKVIEKVSALLLPKTLKNTLVSLVGPLNFEICNWWLYHNLFCEDTVIEIPNNFCWTLHGTVDNKKTAELIVEDETVAIETRYTMACVYCLEKEIPVLWKRIPEARQLRFYYFEDFLVHWNEYPRPCEVKHLVTFWTYTINGKIGELLDRIRKTYWPGMSADQFPFHCAVAGGNKTATQFFFEKFSREGQSLDLLYHVEMLFFYKHTLSSCQAEVLFFMMSRMNDEQQEKVFKSSVYFVLEFMLCWPYQSFFMEIAKKWIGFLRGSAGHDYRYLLKLMVKKIISNDSDYNSKELFVEFWQLCSANYNDFFLGFYVLSSIIELFEAKKENLVKYLLEQATDFQKNQLIYFKQYSFYTLILLIHKEKWNFLKFLMNNVSEETIITFQRNVALQLSTEENSDSKAKLNKALLFVNELLEVRE